MTENHQYNTPEQGETDWHIPLNENFESLDSDVEIRDEESATGDYTPKQNAKFYATDTGSVFIGDGSQWVSVPSTGDEPSFKSIQHSINDNSINRDLLSTYSKTGTDEPLSIEFTDLPSRDYYDLILSLEDTKAFFASLNCKINELEEYSWVEEKRAQSSFKQNQFNWKLHGEARNLSGVCELRFVRTKPVEYDPGRIILSVRQNFPKLDVASLDKGYVDSDEDIQSITIQAQGQGAKWLKADAWIFGVSNDFQ